jgi:hypothetical protein
MTEQDLRDAQTRDFLRGMEDVSATEGSGVAGTGILTQGTNIPTDKGTSLKDLWAGLKSLLPTKPGSGDTDWMRLLLPLLFGGLAMKDKAPPGGGGVGYAYKGPEKQAMAQTVMGKYGPIRAVQSAARGGIMQAYAQGGSVPIRTGSQMMEDGGFVMTKRAVDGAGGPQGIRQMLPQAQLFHGPGDGSGRDDRIKTGIRAANGGITPALVSKNEMYVPPYGVEDAGGPRRVHAMMKSLERRA